MLIPLFQKQRVTRIAAGENHVLAVCQTGQVFSWGCGELGRLGTGDEDDRFSPTPVLIDVSKVENLVKIVDVAAGADNSMLITDEGKVFAAGSNEFNKNGLAYSCSFKSDSANDLAAAGLKNTFDTPCTLKFTLVKPLLRYRIKQIAAGKTHTGAITQSGHLVTFGCNKCGQLGLGDTKPRPRAVSLVAGSLSGKQVRYSNIRIILTLIYFNHSILY